MLFFFRFVNCKSLFPNSLNMTVDSIDMPYFKGIPRQRGRGLGALALSVARTAIPIFRNFIVPAAKKVGRDFIKSAVPEIGEAISGNQSLKRALKSSAKSTIRKQVGGGGSSSKKQRLSAASNLRRTQQHQQPIHSSSSSSNRKRTNQSSGKQTTRNSASTKIKTKNKSKSRSREDFFQNLDD